MTALRPMVRDLQRDLVMDARREFSVELTRKLSQREIPSLNGFRAIGVLLVILFHFGFPVPGAHGVLMFFVLSGFLITWLLLREQDATGGISFTGFYRRRMLRIFPGFYFYWLVFVAMLVVTHRPVLWPHAWSSFFYVSNYYNAIHGDPNTGFSHTWSLAIEEQFYLLWPFVFVLLRKNLKRMTVALAALIVAVWIHRAVLTLVFHVDQAYLYAAFDTRLDSLMVGCLLAVLLKRGVVSDRWHAVWGTPLAFVTTAAAFVASARLSQIYGTQYRDVIGFAIDPPLVAAMIVQAIALSSTVYARWLDWRVLRFLGTISYSLYLWQQWTLSIARRLDGFPLPVHFAGAMLLTLAAGSFSYYVVERPFLKLKRPKRAVPAAGPFEQPASAPLPVPPVTP